MFFLADVLPDVVVGNIRPGNLVCAQKSSSCLCSVGSFQKRESSAWSENQDGGLRHEKKRPTEAVQEGVDSGHATIYLLLEFEKLLLAAAESYFWVNRERFYYLLTNQRQLSRSCFYKGQLAVLPYLQPTWYRVAVTRNQHAMRRRPAVVNKRKEEAQKTEGAKQRGRGGIPLQQQDQMSLLHLYLTVLFTILVCFLFQDRFPILFLSSRSSKTATVERIFARESSWCQRKRSLGCFLHISTGHEQFWICFVFLYRGYSDSLAIARGYFIISRGEPTLGHLFCCQALASIISCCYVYRRRPLLRTYQARRRIGQKLDFSHQSSWRCFILVNLPSLLRSFTSKAQDWIRAWPLPTEDDIVVMLARSSFTQKLARIMLLHA